MIIPNKFNKLGISSGKDLPSDYIVYISGQSKKEKAQSGQNLVWKQESSASWNDRFTTYAGIPCFRPSFVGNNNSDGKGCYVEDDRIPTGNMSARSVSIWFTQMGNNSGDRSICNIGVNETEMSFGCGNVTRTNELRIEGYYPGLTITKGVWYHLCVTYVNNNLKVYINGSKIYENSSATIDNSVYHIFQFGGQSKRSQNESAQGWYWNGFVSSARLYDRVLTPQNVLKLYRQFTPIYQITADDPQTFSFYQKNETFGISYSSAITPTFQIVSGSLPSSITFNTSTGQFTGKGLTDADHTYQLRVRMYGENLMEKTITVNINTYKTARINWLNQTFSFINDGSESANISYTSDQTVSFMPLEALPEGISLSSTGVITSNGNQQVASSTTIQVKATSQHNTTGVIRNITFNVSINTITVPNKTITFYAGSSAEVKIKYSSNKVITPVYSYSGTLPSSVTFNSATGTFICDGTQTTSETVTIAVTVGSSTGLSTAGTATYSIQVSSQQPAIPTDYDLYIPCQEDMEQKVLELTPTYNSSHYQFLNDSQLNHYYIHCEHHSFYESPIKWATGANAMAYGTGAFTISFWFRSSNFNNTNPIIIGKRRSDTSDGFTIFKDVTGSGKFDARIGKENANLSTDETVQSSDWHHWCFTRDDSGNWKWYKDGVLNNSGTESLIGNVTTDYDFRIGSSQNWFYRNTNFDITIIRSYPRQLSATEITALANEFTQPVAGVIRISGATGTALGQSMAGVKYDDYDLTVLNGDYELLSGTHGTKTAVYKNSNNILIKYAEGPGRWLIGRLLDDWQQDFVYMGASFQESPVASDYTKNAYSGFFTFSGATDPLSVTQI